VSNPWIQSLPENVHEAFWGFVWMLVASLTALAWRVRHQRQNEPTPTTVVTGDASVDVAFGIAANLTATTSGNPVPPAPTPWMPPQPPSLGQHYSRLRIARETALRQNRRTGGMSPALMAGTRRPRAA
jgi:hypothetical protein